MRESNPETEALIRAGRAAFRPQASDRDRVLESLGRALGADAVVDGTPNGKPGNSMPPARLPMRPWVVGGLGTLGVGAAVLVATHPWTKPPSHAAAPVTSSVPAAEPSATLPPSSNEEDRIPGLPRTEGPSSVARPRAGSSAAHSSPDSLSEEVRLLSKAEQQLNSGHPDEALRTLGEHERRFPGGALAEERLAARIQSLCALGRISEAKSDLARLARAYPQSAQVDRARRFCGIDAP
jgi:hypothetical protein